MSTNADGTRNYAATPTPLKGLGGEIHDFSEVGFPVWPNLNVAMPRDTGFGTLASAQQTTENNIRMGVTACDKCHGDPDGSGPLAAPAQGDQIYSQPSRAACGSCHDDIVWTQPYAANGQTMPAQTNDSGCAGCHTNSGNSLDAKTAHVHPLTSSTLNTGMKITTSAVTPSTGTMLDPGEKLGVTLSITNDAGTNLDFTVTPGSTLALNVGVIGPTSNNNSLLYGPIPLGILGAVANSYTFNVPDRVRLEKIGAATGGADVFTTSKTPIWNYTGEKTVREGTVTATATTVATATVAQQNYMDVASATGFANNDYLVIDRGTANEEYMRVRRIVGARFWFNTRYDTAYNYQPYLRVAHAVGAAVEKITVSSKTETTAWSISDAANGKVTLVAGQFTAGKVVLMDYMSDWVMPSVYPPPLNDSTDLDETWGEWAGKNIVDGTYIVGIWGRYTWTYNPFGDNDANHNNSYPVTSLPNNKEFLVGAAATIVPYTLISSGENCNVCHNTLYFHGGSRRDFGTCILCHATAGSEDWPSYRGNNATPTAFPATDNKVTINFRTMLHKIHMGEELTNGSTYVIHGNNASSNTFDEINFPAVPGKVKHCDKCHGTSTVWKTPGDRSHPTQQTLPARVYRASCGSCHDSTAAAAHIDLQTSAAGAESCAVCHGTGRAYAVEIVHKNR
ncbi:MAG: hypothetical protein HY719_10635 [Planctomycetes bacterium]|nr:hypothetical protein [Planctomycetota bacterium]